MEESHIQITLHCALSLPCSIIARALELTKHSYTGKRKNKILSIATYDIAVTCKNSFVEHAKIIEIFY